jgi:hypothetical protein
MPRYLQDNLSVSPILRSAARAPVTSTDPSQTTGAVGRIYAAKFAPVLNSNNAERNSREPKRGDDAANPSGLAPNIVDDLHTNTTDRACSTDDRRPQ